MLYKVIHSGLNSVVKRPTKSCNLFCNIAENELKTVVACFTTRVQTYLATNQVLDGCKYLLQKVRVVLLFETTSVHVARFNSSTASPHGSLNFFFVTGV